jgi:hypothetical protein
MNPLLCSRNHRQVKLAVKTYKFFNIINTATKTYKKYQKSHSMIKKLCASHQEIGIIADAYFEIKKLDTVSYLEE